MALTRVYHGLGSERRNRTFDKDEHDKMSAEAVLTSVVSTYRTLLQPVPPFTWLGSSVSTLDVVAALRLCVVLRQLRDAHLRNVNKSGKVKDVEESSRVKNVAMTLVVVYGGESVMSV